MYSINDFLAKQLMPILITLLTAHLAFASESYITERPFESEQDGLCMSFESGDACDERLYEMGDIDAACEGVECLGTSNYSIGGVK